MRVNFVGSAPDGTYIYRCLNPMNYSQHYTGGDIDMKKEEWQMRPDILEADVVIFHRPKDERRLQMMRLLKQKGIKVGYDNDDTWFVPPSHPLYGKVNTDKHQECLNEADFVTTSTEFLANEYRKERDNVHVLPNLVDFSQYSKPKEGREKGRKRVLLTGSVIRCGDGFNFWDTLKRLEAREDIQLVIFGNYDRFYGLDAEYHEFVSPLQYPQKLKDLDIDLCLIPREENYFNKCKSNCKYLEMSALKIPTIAQSFSTKDSPYDLVAQEGAPIELATNNWEEKIDKVTPKLGEDAYHWVRENYNAELNLFDNIICNI